MDAPSQFELIVNAVDKILPPLQSPAKDDEGKIRIEMKAKRKVKSVFKKIDIKQVIRLYNAKLKP